VSPPPVGGIDAAAHGELAPVRQRQQRRVPAAIRHRRCSTSVFAALEQVDVGDADAAHVTWMTVPPTISASPVGSSAWPAQKMLLPVCVGSTRKASSPVPSAGSQTA
jgi:hypothetical protein